MGNPKYIFTVYFRGEYPFGVRYLLEVPGEVLDLSEYFKTVWFEKIGKGKEFDGEILFIEETESMVPLVR